LAAAFFLFLELGIAISHVPTNTGAQGIADEWTNIDSFAVLCGNFSGDMAGRSHDGSILPAQHRFSGALSKCQRPKRLFAGLHPKKADQSASAA